MSTTTIYINGRFLTHSITGVQRYAMELIRQMDAMIGEGDPAFAPYRFVILAPHGELQKLELTHIEQRQVGPLSGHLWEQLTLPLHTTDGFLLNLCNTAPLFKRSQAVTMHDAAVYAVPQTYSWAFKAWYKIVFRTVGMTARRIITCSEFSKQQLIKYVGIKEDKLQTIYHGKEHMLDTPIADGYTEAKGLERPFVLAVSSMSPNKNFRAIVAALELIGDKDFDVVIAGGKSNIFNETTPGGESSGRVHYLGYVAEEELRALYDKAACFVFPSFYEGFGLPPLEAMACGAPVIASGAASLPEVCGDAVLYCDPHDPQDIADQIRRVMGDPQLREELRAKGRAQAAKFSWSRCARETIGAVARALGTSEVYRERQAGKSAIARK
ncbi:glycosyltransferase family 4 protein [Paenibacillus sp. 1P07SE]|uniref:glycosyltransferase family 4 protein n=1 Tax=Paenibacillus sp. 1P07SE TaxID=3132209 RepID=UPI0039A741AC